MPRVVLALLLLLLALPTHASGQAELMTSLDATLGKLMGRADYRITVFPDERVERQDTDFGFLQHNVTVAAPLWQDSRNELSVSARARLQEFDTRAVLPDTGRRFPQELWDVRLGGTYRHKFDNDWIAGGSLTVGSASDEPFASEDELIVQTIGFLRVPARERDAWLFTLLYASDQEFLGNFPIPGAAYLWQPSDRFRAVVGVPFSSVEYKPVEPLTLEASYFPLRKVRARATWVIFRPLRAYLGFDWDNEQYFLADRRDANDRLYYYEKRATAGARFDLRHVGIEVYGGYVFDRFYFQGEKYDDRWHNQIDVEPGPFAGVRIGVRW